MKVIVAGSRTLKRESFTHEAIDVSPFQEMSEIVSGAAPGPDTFGMNYAKKRQIDIKKMPAEWKVQGKKAGILRNETMGDYADALIAVWDGESKGTAHMIKYMKKLKKPVFIYKVTITHYQDGTLEYELPNGDKVYDYPPEKAEEEKTPLQKKFNNVINFFNK